MMKSMLPIGVATTLAVLTACGASPRQSTNASVRRDTSPVGVRSWLPGLRLNQITTEATNSRCRLAMRADIALEGSTLRGIVLSDVMQAPCEVMVSPNKRFYALKPSTSSCGGHVYSGVLPGLGRIIVRDNSAESCEAKPAGAIEVEETNEAGTVLRYAGDW